MDGAAPMLVGNFAAPVALVQDTKPNTLIIVADEHWPLEYQGSSSRHDECLAPSRISLHGHLVVGPCRGYRVDDAPCFLCLVTSNKQ